MKGVAPVAEDYQGYTHPWMMKTKDEEDRRMAVVSAVDEADRHPLKVEKDTCLKVAVVPLLGRLGALPSQGVQTRPSKDILRFLGVSCV